MIAVKKTLTAMEIKMARMRLPSKRILEGVALVIHIHPVYHVAGYFKQGRLDAGTWMEIRFPVQEQDGEYQIGYSRFTDYEDGTVTDNSTGLMWYKNGNA